MKTDKENIDNKRLDELVDSFNGISDDNNEELLEFVESNFDYLINYKTEDVIIIEDISSILNDYFGTLGLCSHWTQIINRKEQAFHYILQLKDKSDKFDKHFYDIEYVYSSALMEQGNDYKLAIKSLEKLNVRFPKDEEIIMNLKFAKFQLRQKNYSLLFLSVLIGFFCAHVIGLVFVLPIAKLIGNILFVVFILIIIIERIDQYNSTRIKPSS